MSKLTVTRQFLFQADQQIKILKVNQPAFAILLHHPINKFYAAAQMHLKIIDARFNEIKNKYVEKDDAGNFLMEEIEGTMKWKLMKVKVDITQARTMNAEEIEKAFDTEGNKMFSQEVTIEW